MLGAGVDHPYPVDTPSSKNRPRTGPVPLERGSPVSPSPQGRLHRRAPRSGHPRLTHEGRVDHMRRTCSFAPTRRPKRARKAIFGQRRRAPSRPPPRSRAPATFCRRRRPRSTATARSKTCGLDQIPRPLDLSLLIKIRRPLSEDNGSAVLFAKESLPSFKINLRSLSFQKYFQFNPALFT